MDWFFQSPQDRILAAVLLVLATWMFIRGTRLVAKGLRNPDHPQQTLWVVRGFRRGITAIATAFFAGGLYFHATWPLIFGAVFLGEELLETGIMILALKKAERAEKAENVEKAEK